MKKNISALTLSVLLVASIFAGCSGPAEKQEKPADDLKLESFNDRVSYMLGTDIGSSLKGSQAEIDPVLISRGLEDSFNGRELLLSPEEIEKIKVEFTEKLQEQYSARIKELSDKNLAEGKAFLAENAKKPGVITTTSGLQYEVVTQGSGPKPGLDSKVKVHYRGTLLNGKEFDSSYLRDEPVELKLSALIPGWSEALQLMPVGSKYKLVVPADLAYGNREVGPDIGPNSTLLFEVELLGIAEE